MQFAKQYCQITEDGVISGATAAEQLQAFLGETVFANSYFPSEIKSMLLCAVFDLLVSSENRSSINGRKFFVATQDTELRSRLRSLPGTPLIYLNKVIMVLEPPSDQSKAFHSQVQVNDPCLFIVFTFTDIVFILHRYLLTSG